MIFKYLLATALLALALACTPRGPSGTAGDGHLSSAECRSLVEKSAQIRGTTLQQAEIEKRSNECRDGNRTTRTHYQCAMSARTPQDLDACRIDMRS